KYFMGLEYEDAYIFASSARHFLLGHTPSTSPLQTQVCVLGSLTDCQLTGTYGGHFISLPLIAFLVQRVCGYHQYTINMLNLIASLVSVVLLYFLAIRITGDSACGTFASLVYATSPAMSIFHTTGLAETTSSLFVLIYVYSSLC